MQNHETYNPSLRGPVLLLIAAAAVTVAGGAVWFDRQGSTKIEGALQALRHERVLQREEQHHTAATLQQAAGELDSLRAEREAKAEYARFLMDRIQSEQQAMVASWEEQRPHIQRARTLEQEIADLRDELRAYNTDILETDWKIESKRAEVTGLESQVEERRQAVVASGDLQASAAAAGRQTTGFELAQGRQ